MCIRDRYTQAAIVDFGAGTTVPIVHSNALDTRIGGNFWCWLLYTSDAADERSSVDLGGRRIIKKKKKHKSKAMSMNNNEKIRGDNTSRRQTTKKIKTKDGS